MDLIKRSQSDLRSKAALFEKTFWKVGRGICYISTYRPFNFDHFRFYKVAALLGNALKWPSKKSKKKLPLLSGILTLKQPWFCVPAVSIGKTIKITIFSQFLTLASWFQPPAKRNKDSENMLNFVFSCNLELFRKSFSPLQWPVWHGLDEKNVFLHTNANNVAFPWSDCWFYKAKTTFCAKYITLKKPKR